MRLTVAGALAVAALVGLPSVAARPGQATPLVGANYTQLAMIGPCGRLYILLHGHEPGQRRAMRLQLAAMRAAGLQSLRFFVWHDHAGEAWEAIPSAGGRLVEPYRGNFVAYLEAARALGFQRLEIVFGPVLGNDPMAIWGGRPYEPALFDENWSLVQDVRALAKEHGPPTRFDLLNEGAPSDGQVVKPQVMDYIARLYRNYVDAYGNDDVTVSTIYQQIDPTRLPNLLEALRASGRPLPTYFEIHPDYDALLAIRDLRDADRVLSATGLAQPLVIGEAPYDDGPAAKAFKEFVDESGREVTDVLEWPLQRGSRCAHFSVGPPYRAIAYVQALQGSAALTATGRLSASLPASGLASLTNGAGLPVTALADGVYELRVADRSRTAGFVLRGPGIARATGARSSGITIWKLALKAGTYRFGATSGPRRAFSVLQAPK